MQAFLFRVFTTVAGFLSPGNVKRILSRLKEYWVHSDVGGKLMLILFFAPSIAVLFWMIGYIAFIVVFTLPGIVLTIIAQAFLFGIFWSGAVFFYEKLKGPLPDKVDFDMPGAEQGKKETWTTFSWREKR